MAAAMGLPVARAEEVIRNVARGAHESGNFAAERNHGAGRGALGRADRPNVKFELKFFEVNRSFCAVASDIAVRSLGYESEKARWMPDDVLHWVGSRRPEDTPCGMCNTPKTPSMCM